jgi:hypothetical protein
MRRRVLALLGVVGVVAAVASGPAALAAGTGSATTPRVPAAASGAPAAPFSSCTQPPQAAAANEVAGGVLDPASADLPKPLAAPAPAPAPGGTAARPATTQLDLWGWTGFAWPDYDPGSSFGSCTLGQASHVEDTAVGFIARAQLETLVWASAATTGVARAAYDPQRYDVLAGLEGTIRDGLGEGIAKVLFPLVAAVIGGWLVITAERRSPREQARHAGGIVLLGISVVLVGVWTLTLGPALDQQVTKAVTWVTATVNRTPTDSDPGREVGESLRTNLIEPTWRYGMFGAVDGPTATTFGPSLLHSAAISNQERADLASDPRIGGDQQKLATALAGLADAKSQAYDRFAADLKTKDPRAYLVLSGSHNDRRLWAATMGWISFWGVAAVQWLASVLSIWCLTILRLIVQAWPAVALIGLVRRRAAVRVFGIAVGAAVADVGVSAVAAVERVGMKAVLSWQADGGGVAAIVLALVVAALSLWACWPFVRCVPGMPARIRRLALPFTGSSRPRPEALPAAVPDVSPAEGEPVALPVRRGRHALPAGPRVPEALAFVALPAEAAPGREVQPIPRTTRRPELPTTVPAPPRDRRQEPPWTSAPSAVPFSGASPPSVPGRRGRPAAPEPSLESV